jgi:rhamnose utilization protein RhaD (predicted bifunctional aldolase and dehydrogenase)
MHPNAIIAVVASAMREQLTRNIFGGSMGYVRWMREDRQFKLGFR